MAGSPEETIIIDSNFESGNLDMAIQIDKNEYDMYMRVDSNTRGPLTTESFLSAMWFVGMKGRTKPPCAGPLDAPTSVMFRLSRP